MIIASIYPSPFDTGERHESNASIIKDGQIYSYEEAKLTSVKLDSTIKYPERSLFFGCKQLRITPDKINKWVFPRISRKINDYELIDFFSYFKIYFKDKAKFQAWKKNNIVFYEHHLMHAGLAVYGSKFRKCSYITADGGGDGGDFFNFKFGEFDGKNFKTLFKFKGNESLASFHGWIADAMGMSGGENGKVSGLAAYGEISKELRKKFYDILPVSKLKIGFKRKRFVGSKVNLEKLKAQEYDRAKIINTYPSDTNVFRISKKFLPQDIAATAEDVLIEKFLTVLKKFKKITKYNYISFSGGLFNNVGLNNKIIESKIFDDVYFTFAPSDSGLSLGGALILWHKIKKRSNSKSILSPYLGPSFSDAEIEEIIKKFNLKYKKVKNKNYVTAKLITNNKVIGYFQGRAEIGPRSLGARSILANPSNKYSKAIINQHLKKRDWYMPYAPSINIEFAKKYTRNKYRCRYMQIAYKIDNNFNDLRSSIHNDFTSRIHCVDKKINPNFWNLIQEIKKINGIPAVLNTSFNRHGISTISSPRQAIEHLLEGCMDYLIISNYVISAKDNRKFNRKKIKIDTELENLKKFSKKRFRAINKFLTKNEKKHYLKSLNRINLNKNKIINIKNKIF